jgi:hypothetical protein
MKDKNGREIKNDSLLQIESNGENHLGVIQTITKKGVIVWNGSKFIPVSDSGKLEIKGTVKPL